MKIFDVLATAFGNLFKRKTRTLLTLLGVILGSASVTLTFAIGNAVKQNSNLILQSTGELKNIWIYKDMMGQEDDGGKDKVYLDDEFINKVKKMPGVNYVFYTLSPENGDICLYSGPNNKYFFFNIIGVDFEDAIKSGLKLKNNKPIEKSYKFRPSNKEIKVIGGEYFEYQFENTTAKTWAKQYRGDYSPYIIWANSKYNFDEESGSSSNSKQKILPPFVNADKNDIFVTIRYDYKRDNVQISENDVDYNSEEQEKKVEKKDFKKYKIILEDRADWESNKENMNEINYYAANSVFVSIDTMKELIKEYRKLTNTKNTSSDSKKPEFEYTSVTIDAKTMEDVLPITKELEKMGYNPYNAMRVIEAEQLRGKSNQFILGFLGCLTLLVSAISISNTMVTSVYERTKEIGIMKVLGCKLNNIRSMFLLESAIIGSLGGVVGVFLSYLFSNFMNKLITSKPENMGAIAKIISQYIEGMKSELANMLGNGITLKVSAMDMKLCLGVIIGTTIIGLLAGYFPSLAASKVSALKAIKTEQ